MKLYYYSARGDLDPIRMLLHVVSFPYTEISTNPTELLFSGKSMRYSLLPLLEDESFTLYSAAAIMRYLARRFDMYGTTSIETAQIDEWLEICSQMMRKISEQSDGDQTISTWMNENRTILQEMDDNLAKNDHHFVVGRKLSIADLVLKSTIDTVSHELSSETVIAKISQEYPLIGVIYSRVSSLPEIEKFVKGAVWK